jgi:hypothetical protein
MALCKKTGVAEPEPHHFGGAATQGGSDGFGPDLVIQHKNIVKTKKTGTV